MRFNGYLMGFTGKKPAMFTNSRFPKSWIFILMGNKSKPSADPLKSGRFAVVSWLKPCQPKSEASAPLCSNPRVWCTCSASPAVGLQFAPAPDPKDLPDPALEPLRRHLRGLDMPSWGDRSGRHGWRWASSMPWQIFIEIGNLRLQLQSGAKDLWKVDLGTQTWGTDFETMFGSCLNDAVHFEDSPDPFERRISSSRLSERRWNSQSGQVGFPIWRCPHLFGANPNISIRSFWKVLRCVKQNVNQTTQIDVPWTQSWIAGRYTADHQTSPRLVPRPGSWKQVIRMPQGTSHWSEGCSWLGRFFTKILDQRNPFGKLKLGITLW